MRLLFALCCFAFLGVGCVSQQEREARMQAQIAAADAADANRCANYGAQPGTPAYTQCRMQLTQMRQDAAIATQAQQTAILGQMIQNNQAALAQQQAQQQQNLQNVVRPLPTPSMQTNCTTSYVGNQAYTRCQ
ncbi:MAG: hypothetical protein ACLP19_18090 [Xanthobacteraceae bacterium]